jgi:hypothetical protein
MRRVRIEPKARRDKDERPVLPVDPRDPDIVRAKRAAGGMLDFASLLEPNEPHPATALVPLV